MTKISNKSIPLLADFQVWAMTQISKGTVNNYCTWLKNIPKDIQMSSNHPLYDYLRIIGSFVMNGDRLFAQSIIVIIEGLFEDYVKKNPPSTTLSNDSSALNKYKEFIISGINYDGEFEKCTGCIYNINDKEFIAAQKLVKKSSSSIDSMMGLLSKLGVETFIKMAIESSFFLSKEIADERFEIIKKESILPARWSTDSNSYTTKVFQDPTQKEFCCKGYCHDVIIDGGSEGNRKRHENYHVDQLINSYTGYTLKGKNSILKNYIISHIWSNASDPRYYTNFWNVVIVPAWANFLLDKKGDAPKGSLASIFKATMMKICKVYYEMENMDWCSISMQEPCVINSDDILELKGDDKYYIHILNKKGKRLFGSICSMPIDIKSK